MGITYIRIYDDIRFIKTSVIIPELRFHFLHISSQICFNFNDEHKRTYVVLLFFIYNQLFTYK